MELLEDRNLLTTTIPAVAFQRPQQIQLLPDHASVVATATADINQDGFTDLVIASTQFPKAASATTSETLPPTDDAASPSPNEGQHRLDVFMSDGANGFVAQSLEHDTAVETLYFVTDDAAQPISLVAGGLDQLTVWPIAHDGQQHFAASIYGETAGRLIAIADLDGNDHPDFLTQLGNNVHMQQVPVADGQTVEPEMVTVELVTPDSRSADPDHSKMQFATVVGDMDGDVDLDLAVACVEGCAHHDLLQIHENDGTGEFSPPRSLPATDLGAITRMAWTPPTASSPPSLLMVHQQEGSPDDTLGIYDRASLAATSENLVPSQSIAMSGTVEYLLADDVDGDSLPDLLIRTTAPSTAGSRDGHFVLLGQAEGRFSEPVSIPLPESDLILATHSQSPPSIFSLSPTGLLSQTPIVRLPNFADELVLHALPIESLTSDLVDLNNDQHLDLIGVDGTSLQFLIGGANGDFTRRELRFDHLHHIRYYTGQFDSDAARDLVVVGSELSGQTHVMRIEFEQDVPVAFTSSLQPLGIVIEQADLNADGLDDFVFRSQFDAVDSQTAVLLNQDESWTTQVLSVDSATVAIDNLDQDDAIEIFVFEDPIRVFKYQDGQFAPWGTIPKGTTRALQADLNGDGLVDFLSIFRDGHQGNTISPFVNNNDGTWSAWESVQAHEFELLDLNHDGLLDIATSRRLFFNTGGERWDATDQIVSDTPEWSERHRYVDVNSDGLLDIATLHLTTGQLSLHVTGLDGQWTDLPSTTLSGDEYDLVDVNGDGRVDVIDHNNGEVTISLQSEDGWDASHALTTDAREVRVIQQGPDASGPTGLLVVSHSSYSIYTQTPDGEFAVASTTETGPTELADINLDGTRDLVLVEGHDSRWTSGQTVMWGTDAGFAEPQFISPAGLGQPTVEWSYEGLRLAESPEHGGQATIVASSLLNGPNSSRPFELRVVDFDHDGDQDVLSLHADGLVILHGVGAGDFDRDGQLSAHDLALLQLATQEEYSAYFDLNRDGQTNQLDLRAWLEDLANVLPGDTDLDGDVDFNDFLNLSQRFGQLDATWSQGDLDGDGKVGFQDFLLLSVHFGEFQLDPGFVPLQQ